MTGFMKSFLLALVITTKAAMLLVHAILAKTS